MGNQETLAVKIFEHLGRYYCYDLSTNNIFEIEKILAEFLQIYNGQNETEVFNFLSKVYDDVSIKECINTIKKYNFDNCGFLPYGKKFFKFPFSHKEYAHLLNNIINHVIVNLTDDCNMRCVYCAYSGQYKYNRKHGANSMSWPVLKKVVDFFAEKSNYIQNCTDLSCILSFYGGEPILCIDKIKMAIQYIKDQYPAFMKKINFAITTNGTLLDEEIIKFLIKNQIRLTISLDGPQEINDRYRLTNGGKGSYAVIYKNLMLIKQMDKNYYLNKVHYSIVLTPKFQVKEVIEFFQNSDFPETSSYYINLVHPLDNTLFDYSNMEYDLNKFSSIYNEYVNEYKQMLVNQKSIPKVLHDFLKFNFIDLHNRCLENLPEQNYPNGICLPGIKKLFVDTDGNFHMCEKINPYFSIGDVENGFDLNKIYENIERYIQIINTHCQNCWALRFCSDCYISAIEGNAYSNRRKEYTCELSKDAILFKLKQYVEILERYPAAFDNGIRMYDHDKEILFSAVKCLQNYQGQPVDTERA